MSTEFIWRYLDIEKFSMLLKQQALFFCSAKKFEDPFEGEFAWGRVGYDKFIETQKKLCLTYGGGMDLDMFMAFNLKTLKEISENTYISCWHNSEHESEAMWRLYCKNPAKGVVIKSKKKTLQAHLENKGLNKLQLKSVKYIPNFWIKQYNPESDVFFSKRPSFEFEKEFRAIFQEDTFHTSSVNGKLIPVSLIELLDEIRTSPFADQNFKNEVLELSKQYGLDTKVKVSEIEMHPIMSVEEKIIAEGSGWYQSKIRLAVRGA
ncbi:DUF2971 domain-containing protein [Enterobacter soli]|uniref:DUF2971 domain-containing protein n=1 Tax=Enterobacter soli TaxID=885040 RepID=A0AAW8H910_9ENTR|nr:DUF2971 domain-containing protein [Enterobacter soli]MDQ2256474.1 DUF2971 domain-containing protein [Enterobacter soli]MDQ2339122.1 DUF2971 domain-containing protein [Enterobacter soli]